MRNPEMLEIINAQSFEIQNALAVVKNERLRRYFEYLQAINARALGASSTEFESRVDCVFVNECLEVLQSGNLSNWEQLAQNSAS